MLANPKKGVLYRQEFSLGNAEDMGEVIGFVDSITVNGKSYRSVLKIKDFNPIEPDIFEYKYYSPEDGIILEENPKTGERVELTQIRP